MYTSINSVKLFNVDYVHLYVCKICSNKTDGSVPFCFEFVEVHVRKNSLKQNELRQSYCKFYSVQFFAQWYNHDLSYFMTVLPLVQLVPWNPMRTNTQGFISYVVLVLFVGQNEAEANDSWYERAHWLELFTGIFVYFMIILSLPSNLRSEIISTKYARLYPSPFCFKAFLDISTMYVYCVSVFDCNVWWLTVCIAYFCLPNNLHNFSSLLITISSDTFFVAIQRLLTSLQCNWSW